MKENLLSPRQWAFVVVAGGAVCSLPFMQRSDQPAHESQSTNSAELTGSALDGLALPPIASLNTNGDALASTQGLPQWANVNRSPFDELVGQKVTPPATTPPADQLPIQPLRPWISVPDDLQTIASARPAADQQTHSAMPVPTPNLVANGSKMASPELSPWRDDPASLGPYDQAVGWVDGHGPNQSAGSSPRSLANAASQKGTDAWPDQKVSEEQIAQRIQSPRRELVSATIPASSHATFDASVASASAAAVPAHVVNAPALSRSQTAHPVAAQVRFGQSPDATQPPPSSAPTPPTTLPLPTLPESRKQHVIFQPPRRK